MEQSRTKNTIRNISAGLIGKIVGLVLPFIIRTIIIYRMGTDYAGLSSLFSSILQVLSVAELGFSSAIIFSLYKPVAENNEEEICQWLSLYRRIYLIVGTVILAAGCLVMPFLRFLIKGNYPADINLYLLYGIYLAGSVISYFVVGYKNVILTVYQRQDILSNIDLGVNIVRSIIQITVLMICNNYYLYIIWNPIFVLVSNFLVDFITKRKYPNLVCTSKVPRDKFKQISKQIKGVALGKFSLLARNAFDSIILSALLGLTAVTMYSNYYFVFTSIGAILIVLLQAMSASVGNSIATETQEKNLSDHHKFDFYFSWITSWVTICMACLYQPFMKLWVGETLILPYHTMILFCVYFYVNQLSQVRSIYSEAAGLWWDFRYVTIGEMLTNLTLNIVLGSWLGVDGILLATIISAFISSYLILTHITFKKFFHASTKKYYQNTILYMLATVGAGLVSILACSMISVDGLGGLLLRLGICIILPNAILLLVYCCFKEYRTYCLSIVQLIQRKKIK